MRASVKRVLQMTVYRTLQKLHWTRTWLCRMSMCYIGIGRIGYSPLCDKIRHKSLYILPLRIVTSGVCMFVWLYVCKNYMYVCLSVRSLISKTTCQNFTEFSVYVNCGRGSDLLWRQCNTLCTSGFVDDMLSHNGANGAESNTTLCLVEFARWRTLGQSLMSTIALFKCH